MLEWMIAITAVCGAVSGIAILYITLGAALRMRAATRATRRALRAAIVASGPAELPRARIHRYARAHAVASDGERVPRVRARRCRRGLAA